MKIEYIEINPDDIDIIRSLWEKQLEHHKAVSKYFKEGLSHINFDVRKKQLQDKSRGGALRIDLAKDSITGKHIGYCVSSLTPEKLGKIESIYVEKEYRLSGIGDNLMTRALSWLDAMSAKRKILGVGEDNESVFAFYRRYNFYPKTTILEHKINR